MLMSNIPLIAVKEIVVLMSVSFLLQTLPANEYKINDYMPMIICPLCQSWLIW